MINILPSLSLSEDIEMPDVSAEHASLADSKQSFETNMQTNQLIFGTDKLLDVKMEIERNTVGNQEQYEADFLKALFAKNVEAVKDYLIKIPELFNYRDKAGLSPLHIAVELGDLFLVYSIIHTYEMIYNNWTLVDWQDFSKNTPLLLAARMGHADIVEYLIDKDSFLDHQNVQGDTALSLAKSENHHAVIQEIEQAIIKLDEAYATETLRLSGNTLQRNEIIGPNTRGNKLISDTLRIKGCALMSHYAAQKDGKPFHGYVADSLKALEHSLSLLDKAKNGTEYAITYKTGQHFTVIKCERHDNINYIISLDSSDFFQDTEETVIKLYGTQNGDSQLSVGTFFFKNDEIRQDANANGICSVYSIKDRRKLLSTSKFGLELHTKYMKENIKNMGRLSINTYTIPPHFMYLASSSTILEHYFFENPSMTQVVVRHDKQGNPENLLQYAYRARHGLHVRSPQIVTNRNYDSRNPASKKQYVKNYTPSYFLEKYIGITNSMITRLSKDELYRIIKQYDANELRISSSGDVLTQYQEEDVFLFEIGKPGQNLISHASQGDLKAVDEILHSFPKAVLFQDQYGRNAMIHALISNNEKIAIRLLQSPYVKEELTAQYRMSVQNDDNHLLAGYTAFFFAIVTNKQNFIKSILHHPGRAEFFCQQTTATGKTPLALAVEVNDVALVKVLYPHCKKAVLMPDKQGRIPLQHAIENGSLSILEILLQDNIKAQLETVDKLNQMQAWQLANHQARNVPISCKTDRKAVKEEFNTVRSNHIACRQFLKSHYRSLSILKHHHSQQSSHTTRATDLNHSVSSHHNQAGEMVTATNLLPAYREHSRRNSVRRGTKNKWKPDNSAGRNLDNVDNQTVQPSPSKRAKVARA